MILYMVHLEVFNKAFLYIQKDFFFLLIYICLQILTILLYYVGLYKQLRIYREYFMILVVVVDTFSILYYMVYCTNKNVNKILIQSTENKSVKHAFIWSPFCGVLICNKIFNTQGYFHLIGAFSTKLSEKNIILI